jgi:excisionase family DNA binding protein
MILLTDDQIELIAERIASKLRVAEKKTYTLKEAAEALSLHPRTVRRLKDDGRLRTLPGTSKLIFPASEIEKLLTHGHTR